MNISKLIVRAVLLPVLVAAFTVQAETAARVLRLKNKVVTKGKTVILKDLVANDAVLSDEEAGYEIMKTPLEADVTMTLVDIAYIMQRYPSLMTAKIKGEPQVVFKRVGDMYCLDNAKKLMHRYLKANQPWKDWEIDVVFSQNDEALISRIGAFSRLEVEPTDQKSMSGTVDFRGSFYDEHDRLINKYNLTPKILCRAEAFVVRESKPKGHVLTLADLKKVPVWLGDDKKGFITEEKLCVGKELARETTAGDYVRVGDLLNPVCARRGEVIWVTSLSGGLSVKLAVQAEQNGRLGDVIRVINRSTQKTFDVELNGSKSAILRMGS